MYLVCEPPGDPYYLCRIMEFLHVESDNPNSPVDALRVNWYYRPRDVQRFNSDTRLVYGTMHSDICPLSSLRGKCMIKHRSEILDLDAYRKERDSFYFVQVFDRFIRRSYECIPVAQIINVPEKVKKALDERWKFVVVEISRVKELTSAVKTCKRCAKYCASHDSVDCAICKNSYHMNCVQPPLPKKPSRGFAWACGPCSRASEKKMEARNTPTVSGDVTEAEEEVVEEEEIPEPSNDTTRAPSPSEDVAMEEHPATAAEIALAKMWPMRYLGIHCRVEDALQYDDRAIYPRASSRLGPRHQANVNVWHGRPVELVKPAEIKKRYNKGNASHKKEGKLTKETLAAIEADREEKAKRPKWVQDEPQGYVARGEDYPPNDPRCTAKLMFKMPEQGSDAEKDALIEDYRNRIKPYARSIGVPPFGVNFLDKAMELLTSCDYNINAALNKLKTVDRKKDLHEPILTKQDLAKFEEGVEKFGSEHRMIRLHMKTNLPNSDIVRFYYLWKKTPKGREVWGNYGGRKGSKKKIESDSGAKLQAEVANDGDDSAFDNEKAMRRNKGFQCKFCGVTHARQWRKAPGVSPGQTVSVESKTGNKKEKLILALCLRCAGLWRKYAIQWEDIDEVAKKVAQGGGRALKRRIDEELLRELMIANEAANAPIAEPPPVLPPSEMLGEPAKKKSKVWPQPAVAPPPEPPKKKEKTPPPPKEPTPPPPPIIPAQPQWRPLPCAVCRDLEDTIACAHCKLTVHRRCFGLKDNEGAKADGSVNWICEQCQNDRHPEVSTDYSCCLCLTEETLIDLVEPPRVSHKKKTDREREKERLEKELADAMRLDYHNKQLSLNRPVLPREPLKRTTGNNWVHVNCAVFAPEIRFSNAQKLEVAEGFQLIPPARYEAVCKLCKNKDHNNKLREDAGACVSCFQCNANFHVSCAFEAGYQFGFDVTPVKGSRRDQVTTAKLGEETGTLTAAIWCKEHAVKSIIHPVNEVVDETGKTALQVFVENYKQADLTLTGTVRKANLAQLTKDKGQQALNGAVTSNRRESTTHSIAAAVRRGARNSIMADNKSEAEEITAQLAEAAATESERRCVKCKIDVTPRWHPVFKTPPPTPPKSPPQRRMSMTLGEYTDLQRERSADGLPRPPLSGANGNSSSTAGAQSESGHSQPDARTSQPPNGATWNAGGNERIGASPALNGDTRSIEPSRAPGSIIVPSREGPHLTTQPNGEPQQASNEEGFHRHALPRGYQNPVVPHTPPLEDAKPVPVAEASHNFLCHKCFVKKKTHPTPSPPPAPAPPALSPPRPFPLQLNWNGPAGTPNPPPARDGTVRTPWDEPQRASQPPPPPQPHMNGSGPLASMYGPATPSVHGSGYPPYGQQPNGFHPPPPPSHFGPPSGSPQHERPPSHGYGPPPSQHQGPPIYGPPPPRPSPLPQYPPVSAPVPNGVPSPQGIHPPLHSPSLYGPPALPSHHHSQYQARFTEPPYANPQLAPIGQPLHSNPSAGFSGPEMLNGQHQHQHQPQPWHAQHGPHPGQQGPSPSHPGPPHQPSGPQYGPPTSQPGPYGTPVQWHPPPPQQHYGTPPPTTQSPHLPAHHPYSASGLPPPPPIQHNASPAQPPAQLSAQPTPQPASAVPQARAQARQSTQLEDPHASQVPPAPEGQPQPSTPRDAQGPVNGTMGPGGASASPNLKNLLH